MKYSAPFQPDQFVRVPGTKAGTNHILAYADVLPTEPAPFSMLAEYLPFALASITPNHGGNAGNVTIKLTGSGIASDSTAKLAYYDTNSVRREILPIRIRRPGSDQLFATFDLRGISPNMADAVLVGNQGQTRTLPGAFQIVTGMSPAISLHISGPSFARKHSIPFYYTATVRNDSNQDADLVNVSCWVSNHPGIAVTVQMLDSRQKPIPARSGYVSVVAPKILGGDEATFLYEIPVSDSFPGSTFPIIGDAKTVERTVFAGALANEAEGWRLNRLSITNRQVTTPWLYALALDPALWRQNEAQIYQLEGYDFTAHELTPNPVIEPICTTNCSLFFRAQRQP